MHRTVAIAIAVVVALEVVLRLAGYIQLRHLFLNNLLYSYRDGDINVLCLGESSTVGYMLAPDESYPKQLEVSLQARYGSDRIHAMIPPHMGQNTSQVANRIVKYLDQYRPALAILMLGANNEWALGESTVVHFLPAKSLTALKLKLLVALDHSRIFKLLRYAYLSGTTEPDETPIDNPDYLLGWPEYRHWPPEEWIYDFGRQHREVVLQAWRHDMRRIISEIKARGVPVLLMSYPINPGHLAEEVYMGLARDENVPLLRNDLSFAALIERGVVNDYLLRDHWHPNKAGYEIIAATVFEWIVANEDLWVAPAHHQPPGHGPSLP